MMVAWLIASRDASVDLSSFKDKSKSNDAIWDDSSASSCSPVDNTPPDELVMLVAGAEVPPLSLSFSLSRFIYRAGVEDDFETKKCEEKVNLGQIKDTKEVV